MIVFDRYAKKMKTGVIDSSEAYPDGLAMLVLDASAFRQRNHPDHVSCSGGPCPGINPEELRLVGTREQRFWEWKDRPRAGGGIDYVESVPLWAYDGDV